MKRAVFDIDTDELIAITPIDIAGEVWRRRYEAYHRAPLKRPFAEQLKEWNERDVALLRGETNATRDDA